jgi:hypothetical protein
MSNAENEQENKNAWVTVVTSREQGASWPPFAPATPAETPLSQAVQDEIERTIDERYEQLTGNPAASAEKQTGELPRFSPRPMPENWQTAFQRVEENQIEEDTEQRLRGLRRQQEKVKKRGLGLTKKTQRRRKLEDAQLEADADEENITFPPFEAPTYAARPVTLPPYIPRYPREEPITDDDRPQIQSPQDWVEPGLRPQITLGDAATAFGPVETQRETAPQSRTESGLVVAEAPDDEETATDDAEIIDDERAQQSFEQVRTAVK